MKANNTSKIPDVSQNNSFDALCQEFDGTSFYGLEYILEDFFQNKTEKPAGISRFPIDWFGLYD